MHEAYTWLQQYLYDDFEIIIVDDGSQDATCSSVESLQKTMSELQLIKQPENLGKGAAVRAGMLQAQGDICLFMDADHSTHISEVEKVFVAMDKTTDIVIASRQHPDSDIEQHQSWLRENMGKSFNQLMRSLVGIDMPDTQCGFKAFSKQAATNIFSKQQLNGFSFDVELLFLAQQLGFQVKEIPVKWVNEPNSKVRLLTDPIKMFADIVRIRKLHKNLK